MQHCFITFFDEIVPSFVRNTETPEPLEGDGRQRLGEEISHTSEHKATYSASQLLRVTILCNPLFQLTAPLLTKLMKPPCDFRVMVSIANDASTAPITALADPCFSSSSEEDHVMAKSRLHAKYLMIRLAASIVLEQGRARCLLSTLTAWLMSNRTAVAQ